MRGRNAIYVYRDLCVYQSFGLLSLKDKIRPLKSIRKSPKRYRLFRTCKRSAVAFYSIKFGKFGGKLEVGMQYMFIAIYAHISVFDYMA